jgi:hypothetical protein
MIYNLTHISFISDIKTISKPMLAAEQCFVFFLNVQLQSNAVLFNCPGIIEALVKTNSPDVSQAASSMVAVLKK